jgi:hypothetical protein
MELALHPNLMKQTHGVTSQRIVLFIVTSVRTIQGKLLSFALILHKGNGTSRKFWNDSKKPHYILEEIRVA